MDTSSSLRGINHMSLHLDLLAAAKRASCLSLDPEWADEATIARMFGVSVHFIRRERYKGRLRASTINGRLVRIKVQTVRDFFEQHAAGGDGKGRSVGRCGVWNRRAESPGQAALRPRKDKPPVVPGTGSAS